MKLTDQIKDDPPVCGRRAQPLAERTFEPVVVERDDLKLFGTALWNMVYFKGRPRK